MISYQTYFKDTSGFNNIYVPHLYEHAFLNAIIDQYPQLPYTSISNATTFRRSGTFMSFTYFDEQSHRQVENFVQENPIPTQVQIDQAILETEAEELGTFKIVSKSHLQEQLNELVSRPWRHLQALPLLDISAARVPLPRAVSFHPAPENFQRIEVTLTLQVTSLEDKVMFSMFANSLMPEVLLHKLREQCAARREAAHFVEDNYNGDKLMQTSVYIVSKSIKRTSIAANVRNVLESFQEAQHLNYLKAYAESYIASGDAGNFVVQAYEQSGVLIGGRALSTLLTRERLERITRNVHIKVGFHSL